MESTNFFDKGLNFLYIFIFRYINKCNMMAVFFNIKSKYNL
jgi:hypothetical protein